MEQFTFIVSHNLRAPLANIIGISNVVGTESLEPNELKVFINGLLISANSLDDVLKDLNIFLQIKRNINDKKELIYFSKLVEDISLKLADLMKKITLPSFKILAQPKRYFRSGLIYKAYFLT